MAPPNHVVDAGGYAQHGNDQETRRVHQGFGEFAHGLDFDQADQHEGQHDELHGGVCFADERRGDLDSIEQISINGCARQDDQVANEDDQPEPQWHMLLDHQDDEHDAHQKLVGERIGHRAEPAHPVELSRQRPVDGVRDAREKYDQQALHVAAIPQEPTQRDHERDAHRRNEIRDLLDQDSAPCQVNLTRGPAGYPYAGSGINRPSAAKRSFS